jgi:hypothetical protein
VASVSRPEIKIGILNGYRVLMVCTACVRGGGMPYIIKIKAKKQKQFDGFRLKGHARDFAKRKSIKHYKLIFFKFIKGPSK